MIGILEESHYHAWLFAVSSAMGGVQFVYSVMFSLAIPLFHGRLKLPTSTSTLLVATAGPVSGFVVQPVVGALSDAARCRWGRRRPFILSGALLCAVGMVLIVLSEWLGRLLGDDRLGESWLQHRGAIGVSIAGLWVMMIFVNATHAPSRALTADIVPENRQHEANGAMSACQAISAVVANVLGAQVFLTPSPYVILFAAAAVVLLLAIVPTLIAAREPDPSHELAHARPRVSNIFGRVSFASPLFSLPVIAHGVSRFSPESRDCRVT